MDALLLAGLLIAGTPNPKKKTVVDFSDLELSGSLVAPEGSFLSARPGGTQDADYFRASALAGEIPQAEAITAEGLLAGHDLPLSAPPACRVLLCAAAEAAPMVLASRPEVTHLVQVGLTSTIDASRFNRGPLELILLVDRSGSMAGQPLELVKETLSAIAAKMTLEDDRIAIVAFGDRAEVVLRPTRDRARIARAIASIEAGGSTAMEAGLARAFALAAGERGFDGTRRVMLFTDERPNVGRTDAGGFRARAEAAARRGVGLTTIGVGTEFGVELATAVSGVRGANLFYFADPTTMKRRIEEELDLMTTELGHDLELSITPAPETRVVDLYGVPAGFCRRRGRALVVSVRSLFASKRRGALFLALASDEALPRSPSRLRGMTSGLEASSGSTPDSALVRVALSFVESGGLPRSQSLAVRAGPPTHGLTRGAAIIDAFVGLSAATDQFHRLGDPDRALAALTPVAARFRDLDDPDLAEERRMIEAVESTLRGFRHMPSARR